MAFLNSKVDFIHDNIIKSGKIVGINSDGTFENSKEFDAMIKLGVKFISSVWSVSTLNRMKITLLKIL